MSTTLSTTSRQFASTASESQVQFDHSAEYAPSIRGIVTSGGGGLPSGSFHTNSCWFCSRVSQDLVRAVGGTRREYGILTHLPSPPQRQSWNGQAIALPLIVPRLRSPPMCRQYPSRTFSSPDWPANTTSLVPNASTACGLPSRKGAARPRQCQPRANLLGGAPASMLRTPFRSFIRPSSPAHPRLTAGDSPAEGRARPLPLD